MSYRRVPPPQILPPGEPMLELVATRRWTLHWPTPGCCACPPWPWWAPPPQPACGTWRRGGSGGRQGRPGACCWGPTAGVRCGSRARPGQHLSAWRPSVLESCPPGHGAQLVPAGTALLMRGFRVLSYSPWNKTGRGGRPGIWARGLPRAGSWLHWDRQLGAQESLGPEGASQFQPLSPRPPEPGKDRRLPLLPGQGSPWPGTGTWACGGRTGCGLGTDPFSAGSSTHVLGTLTELE